MIAPAPAPAPIPTGPGLPNLNNTCYLNAAVQILARTPGLFPQPPQSKTKKSPAPLLLLLDIDPLDSEKKQQDKKVWNAWVALQRAITEFDGAAAVAAAAATPHHQLPSRKLQARARRTGGTVLLDGTVSSHLEAFVTELARQSVARDLSFIPGTQNDVSELVIHLLDTFHMAHSRHVRMRIADPGVTASAGGARSHTLGVKCLQCMKQMYEKEHSRFLRGFYGMQVTTYRRVDTGALLSDVPQPFSVIDLVLPAVTNTPTFAQHPGGIGGAITLEDCLQQFIADEPLQDCLIEDESLPDKPRVPAIKSTRFWILPPVLVFALNRASHDECKKNVMVEFPAGAAADDDDDSALLDMAPFLANDSTNSSPFRDDGTQYNSTLYELYGICYHIGKQDFGHYTAAVRGDDGRWWYYDDEIVTLIADAAYLVNAFAHCLFYRLKQ